MNGLPTLTPSCNPRGAGPCGCSPSRRRTARSAQRGRLQSCPCAVELPAGAGEERGCLSVHRRASEGRHGRWADGMSVDGKGQLSYAAIQPLLPPFSGALPTWSARTLPALHARECSSRRVLCFKRRVQNAIVGSCHWKTSNRLLRPFRPKSSRLQGGSTARLRRRHRSSGGLRAAL